MINSLGIGTVVYSLLSTIDQIGTKCFPLIAENSTSFPFLIYSRESLEPSYCKDGLYEDEVSMTVKVVSNTYDQGISIAQEVREILTLRNYTTEDMKINSQLSSAYESYENDSYIQTLTFRLVLDNN